MAQLTNRKLQKIMTIPIDKLFRIFMAREPVEIWLLDRTNARLTGIIRGFDEYMNIVLGDAVECRVSKDPSDTAIYDRKIELGEILLKGENISTILAIPKTEMLTSKEELPRSNEADIISV